MRVFILEMLNNLGSLNEKNNSVSFDIRACQLHR